MVNLQNLVAYDVARRATVAGPVPSVRILCRKSERRKSKSTRARDSIRSKMDFNGWLQNT
jgi:hypothetical protein